MARLDENTLRHALACRIPALRRPTLSSLWTTNAETASWRQTNIETFSKHVAEEIKGLKAGADASPSHVEISPETGSLRDAPTKRTFQK